MPTQKRNRRNKDNFGEIDSINQAGWLKPGPLDIPKTPPISEKKYAEKEIPSLSLWQRITLFFKPILDYSLQKIGSTIIPMWFFWGVLIVILIIGLVWVL